MAARLERLVRYRRAKRAMKQASMRATSPAEARAKGAAAAMRKTLRAGRPKISLLVLPLLLAIEVLRSGLRWLVSRLVPMPRRVLPLLPPDEFLLVGHRGAPAHAIENTLESFDCALAEGANAIETDFCVTQDGQVVVWHDWDPDELVAVARQAGAEFDVAYRPVVPPPGDALRRPVDRLTLAELRAHYGYAKMSAATSEDAEQALLDDVVRWAAEKGDRVRCVFLDIKIPPHAIGAAKVFVDALESAVARHHPRCAFTMMTPHLAVLQALRSVAPDRLRTLDIEIKPGLPPADDDDADPRFGPYSAVRFAIRMKNSHASIGRPRFTLGGWALYARTVARDLKEFVRHHHLAASGPTKLVCWTLNTPRERRWLLRLGVHGILTDFPAQLRKEYEEEWRAQSAKG